MGIKWLSLSRHVVLRSLKGYEASPPPLFMPIELVNWGTPSEPDVGITGDLSQSLTPRAGPALGSHSQGNQRLEAQNPIKLKPDQGRAPVTALHALLGGATEKGCLPTD